MCWHNGMLALPVCDSAVTNRRRIEGCQAEGYRQPTAATELSTLVQFSEPAVGSPLDAMRGAYMPTAV